MFLTCILEDYQEGKKTENLVPFLTKAYKATLKRYHGWMAQQLFGVSKIKYKTGVSIFGRTGQISRESHLQEKIF